MSRDKNCVIGGSLVLLFTFLAVLAPVLAPHSPIETNFADSLLSPSTGYLFGTDSLGRDVFSRCLYGIRLSLLIAVSATSLALAIALPLGSFAGFLGGISDVIIMRFIEILLALPSILSALIIVAMLGRGLMPVILAVAARGIPVFAILARNCILSLREEDYVEAARAIGERKSSILWRYILPQLRPVILTQSSLYLATAILTAAGLGFLGFSVDPPTPELGILINDSKDFIRTAPWLVIFPGVMIAFIALGFNRLGDGLNDVLNPRLRKEVMYEGSNV